MDSSTHISVRPVDPIADSDFVHSTLTASWGTTSVAAHGDLMDAATMPGVIAEWDGEPVGLVTYRVSGADEWEVVSVDSVLTGHGVGAAMMKAVGDVARSAGVRRLWLITTNDNTGAIRFYQRNGWDMFALHRNAVATARTLKPSIPLTGAHGIPIRHEVELEMLVEPADTVGAS